MRGVSRSALGDEPGPSTLYNPVIFGGQKAAANIRAAGQMGQGLGPGTPLQDALDMEKRGASPQLTFHTTGWYHAPDGEWKWVLSDKGASLNNSAFNTSTVRDYSKSIDFSDKNWASKPAPLKEVSELVPGSKKLSDVLNHPDLYAAYPQLKGATVEPMPDDVGPGVLASYNDKLNRVRLTGGASKDDLLDSLLHEIQHGVQGIEGFGQGGSATMFDPPGLSKMRRSLEGSLDAVSKRVSDFTGEGGWKASPAMLEGILNKIADGKELTSSEAQSLANHKRLLPPELYDQMAKAVYDYQPVRQAELEAFGKYQRLAGETESRQVEAQYQNKDWTQLPTEMPGFAPASEQLVRRDSDKYGVTHPGTQYQLAPVENDPFSPPLNAHYPSQKVPDFTDKYNTYLDPDQEANFQTWLQDHAKSSGRDMSKDLDSYDLRGAYLNNAEQANNGHYPDTYKKPNHPGFSEDSIYHGADGYYGGKWTPDPDDSDQWSYEPSADTLGMHGEEGVRTYLKQGQGKNPPVQLILPKPPLSYEFSPVEHDPFNQPTEPQFAPVEYDPFQQVTPNINVSPKLMPPQSALSPTFGFDYSDYPDLASAAQGNQAPMAEPTSYSTYAKPVNTVQPSSY